VKQTSPEGSEPKFSTTKSLLKFTGTRLGPKEEYYEILKAIKNHNLIYGVYKSTQIDKDLKA